MRCRSTTELAAAAAAAAAAAGAPETVRGRSLTAINFRLAWRSCDRTGCGGVWGRSKKSEHLGMNGWIVGRRGGKMRHYVSDDAGMKSGMRWKWSKRRRPWLPELWMEVRGCPLAWDSSSLKSSTSSSSTDAQARSFASAMANCSATPGRSTGQINQVMQKLCRACDPFKWRNDWMCETDNLEKEKITVESENKH